MARMTTTDEIRAFETARRKDKEHIRDYHGWGRLVEVRNLSAIERALLRFFLEAEGLLYNEAIIPDPEGDAEKASNTTLVVHSNLYPPAQNTGRRKSRKQVRPAQQRYSREPSAHIRGVT